MEVAVIGSYAFHVRRRKGCKVFRVQTDVCDYMYGETLDSTFARCDCYRGKRIKGKFVDCEHTAAVFLRVAEEVDSDDGADE